MANWSKQLNSLSDAQVRLARRFQAAGITSYSQAVKALANHDDERVSRWKEMLKAQEEQR